MNIPWKLKSFIFGAIDFFDVPRALYFLQKHVTKRSRVGKLDISPIWQKHKNVLEQYNVRGLVFEFGAGKSLAQNFYLSDSIDRQIVVDLNPMIDIDLVENVRKQLSHYMELKSDTKITKLRDLQSYGIEYRAPYDAAETAFDDKSLDACISTVTLEHIPKNNIISIFTELYRILKDDGIVSAQIDYSDHYAHTDNSISLLNYLKFDHDTWAKHNHICHYQNRLRHYDYIDIFEKCGFVVLEEQLVYAETQIPEDVIEIFKDKEETWSATSAHIILKKR